jgi:tight adherence protein B
MAARIPLTDLRYLVIAILIQRETGGNLAEILGNIGHIIRGRLRLAAQVRVLSAEGRMSAWILGLLPFAVGAVLVLVNPIYVMLLWTDPIGIKLLWTALVMITIGVIWLKKVIRIRI